jgi:hypothetical protein
MEKWTFWLNWGIGAAGSFCKKGSSQALFNFIQVWQSLNEYPVN